MWFKIDDGFESHPKTLALYDGPCPADALALWALAGSWCGLKLTNGAVPRGFVARSPHRAGAAELVRVGLWIETDDGFQFHDWLKMNPSRDQVLAEREKNRERQAKWYASQQKHNTVPNAVRNTRTNGHLTGAPDPVPVSREEELRTPPNAREELSPFRVGHDLLRDALGNQYGEEWRADLERIGMKPDAERKTVLAAIKSSSWCRENKHAVDPKHVLRQWPRYLAGDPPLKQVARAASGGKYAGPSQVAAPEDYAVKGEIKW